MQSRPFLTFRHGLISFSAIILLFSLFSFIPEKKNRSSETTIDESVLWGFFGHKKINEMAVYTLPEDMFGFYKANLNFIIEHAVDPDKRRYGVKGEAECHFLDADHYCFDTVGCDPFKNLPKHWKDAVARYSEDSLRAHGIVPWHVNLMLSRLTEAMKKDNMTRILRLSAELGHYIADAHVPLHASSNYNGQKTNQRGIHAFWESRLPEIFEPNYDFFVGKAQYIETPLDFIWSRVEESFAAVDTVLGFEAKLNREFPSDQKYGYETRGANDIKVYSRAYSSAYHQMLDDQVERRMRSAVLSIGSFWYTAWINAGQPDLNRFTNLKPDLSILEEMQKEIDAKPDPALKVRDHQE